MGYTLEQTKCIEHNLGNMIVSASAGSGKTQVVISRIINLITNKGVSVDKILAVTFTNLAANEMKERLTKSLIDEFNKTGDLRIKEEISKVKTADISTIHSFLANLLKKYFYLVGLDVSFEVLDDKKSKKLAYKAIDEVFEDLYEEGSEEFLNLLSIYGKSSKDSSLKEIILKLNEFCENEESFDSVREKSLSTQKIAQDILLDRGEAEEEKDYSEDIKNNSAIINGIFNLLEKFQDRFTLLKREENGIDFTDIQTLSLKLLENDEVLNDVKNKYDYIFVDEYQDTNDIQEKIINKIANDNVFMVGDSKQSIYGFRGCNPEFFNNKCEKYSKKDGGEFVPLNKNFRSAKKVLNGVNSIFENVFTKEFCGFDYKDSPMIYGENYKDYEGVSKIHILSYENKKSEEEFSGVYSVVNHVNKNVNKLNKEEKYIIALVNSLLGKKYYDVKKECYKEINYGDICILVRSLNGLGENLLKALVELGFPVSSSVKNKIGGYPEVQAVYRAIKAFCSLNDDISLASLMLNFGDFNENELSLIRNLGGKDVFFYDCVKSIDSSSGELYLKIEKFLNWVEKIRLLSEYESASEVLRRAISESGFDVKLLSTENGNSKMKRVERIVAEADVFDRPLSLSEFNEYLDNSLDEIYYLESDGENTLRIMTVHASKGIEFPVVIAAGFNKQFNDDDVKKPVYFNRHYGIAPKTYYLDSMVVKENPARKLIKKEYNKNQALEEARILYVELTRAKCELHVVVYGEDVASEYNLSNFINVKKQKDFITTNCNFEYPDEQELLKTIEESDSNNNSSVNTNDIKAVLGNTRDENIVEILKNNLTYVYPHSDAVTLPIKNSVSEINHLDSEEYFKTTQVFGDSSSEKGTAYHKFFELSTFESESVEFELENMLNSGLITSRQKELLNVNKLQNILKMPIFNLVKNKKHYKEKKFCLYVKANELGYSSNEEVFVQGIIDLVVEDGEDLILIDYKLSTIESEEDLIKAYKKQMDLYRKALETITGKKVKNIYLVNILQEKTVEVIV